MSSSSTCPHATLFENGAYIGIVLQDILYGIELALYFGTMRIFLARRRQRHRSDVFYAVFSSVMLVLITIWMAAITLLGQKMWLLDRDYPGGPTAYFKANTSVLYMDFGRASLTILQLMADALMIYRCWIVWASRRVLLVPSILWLATLVLGILLNWTLDAPGVSFYGGVPVKLGVAYYSASAFLNVTLSCIICYRLLRHARTVKQYLGEKYASPYITIITLVIESVFPFTLSSVAFLVSYGTGSQRAPLFSFIHQLMTCISPQMLILRVAKGEAWKQDETVLPESIFRAPPLHGDTTLDDGGIVVRVGSLPDSCQPSGPGDDQV